MRVSRTPRSAPRRCCPAAPYDLWRAGEPSRRVKDLAGAFAENPKLPKMLRRKEILDTIDQGVLDGIFVASLVRPDKSVKTWWRTRIDEAARAEPALELCLPGGATLSELDPNVLVPSVLPELWAGESVAVTEVIAYFAGGRTVTVQHEGYSEPVAIPACPRAAVEAATSDAVRQGVLWLVNGPASFQGEPVPPGVLTDSAELRTPMPLLSVDRLTKDTVPEAWQDGETNALALATALSVRVGAPIPWPILRRAIDDALGARWLERAPDSGPWPCEAAGASAVTLKQPDTAKDVSDPRGKYVPIPKGVYTGTAILEPNELQDLVDALPDVVKAAAGVPLQFHVRITLGDGSDVPSETVTSLNELLGGIKSDFCLKE